LHGFESLPGNFFQRSQILPPDAYDAPMDCFLCVNPNVEKKTRKFSFLTKELRWRGWKIKFHPVTSIVISGQKEFVINE